ncbi:MAG: NERD domain-containing protein [Rhodocyclales bacterium]|nr:NERD domain-containing protein [Rhodocyclales bacterium]
MAILRPALDDFVPQGIGQQREAEVLQRLQAGLPDDYIVFHGVEWSSVKDGVQWFGEIDAIVLCPNASLVLLEVKAGPVEFANGGMHKRYGDRVKDVERQIRLQHAALLQRLKEAKLRVYVGQLLVLPDQEVNGDSVRYPRARIVDTREMDYLCQRVIAAAPQSAPNSATADRMCRFLDDVFELAPDLGSRIGWLGEHVNRLSQGLATWVPRLKLPCGRLRIEATAGAGKTQLAFTLLDKAADAGQQARYVCFNRPLAQHLRRLLPAAIEVVTFHELAAASWRAKHGAPDFRAPGLFEQMADRYAQEPGTASLDLLVIDELQDLDAVWVDALLRDVRPGGSAYLLGDTEQCLFENRVAWTDPNCPTLSCLDNYRSPRRIVQTMQALGLANPLISARCPHAGELPGFHVWDERDTDGLAKAAEVITTLRETGVQPEQIAVLSLRGVDRSQVLKADHLGGWPLRRFNGYDARGQAQLTEGVLSADTVNRYKGQAAPVVVLTEMDFDTVDDLLRRRLFVAFTRAQWRLECVMSPRAESALRELLESV